MRVIGVAAEPELVERTERVLKVWAVTALQAGGDFPQFSTNPFFSLHLHGFRASAFACNAYSLARLLGEFSDGFLTVVAATAMLYWLRSTCCSNGFRAAIAPLAVRTRFVEPGNLLSLTTTLCFGDHIEEVKTAASVPRNSLGMFCGIREG